MIVKDYQGGPIRINKATAAHKYCGDPMAEYCDWVAMRDMERGSGDVECPTGYFVQLGRRILFNDTQGFVWLEKWPEEQAATQVFEALDRYYGEWSYEPWNDNEPERTEDEQEAILADCDLYLKYVASTAEENLIAYGYDEWVRFGRPKAYPG